MYKGVKQTGILALGVGTFAYLYNKQSPSYSVFAKDKQHESGGLSSSDPESSQGKAAMPLQVTPEGPQLQLQQVQVMFRHGARTPIHLIPDVEEARYDPQFLMREHQASLFPYVRLLRSTGKPVEWSDYELKITQTPLKNGTPKGTLTSYGKNQVYTLGKTLQSSYRDKLDLASYNPQDVLVLSSNIKRTVESARCVLAGFFGSKQLQEFAETHSPIKIYISDRKYNILVPDTTNCAVLNKVNHAGLFHSDFIPGFKSDRLNIEKQINEVREKNIQAVTSIQGRINKLCGSSGISGSSRPETQDLNEHHQLYLKDPILHTLIEERGRAISKVDKLWFDAIVRTPNLADLITEDDIKFLVYLRKLEVERFGGNIRPGYRFHFYFDDNPYFHNDHLCKEIYTNSPIPGASPSRSTPIAFKEHGKLLQEKLTCQCQVNDENQKKTAEIQKRSCTCESSKKSFLSWYVTDTHAENDQVGKIIRDEVWADPVKCLEGKSKFASKWDKSFNFLFGRDDLVARETHGLTYPTELKKYDSLIADHAVTMLYYSLTGQHDAERGVVARLSAGPLLTTMVKEFEKVVKGDKHAFKMCLYSSHDSTMAGLLELLDIWDNRWPPFAADIRLELYKDVNGSEYYIRILYCGQLQKIRGQREEFVPWTEFVKTFRRYLIHQDEYWRICASDVLEKFAKDLLKHEEGEVISPSETPAGM